MNGWYNSKAKELMGWAMVEQSRFKASMIRRAAERMEQRYRQTHDLGGCKPTIAVPLPYRR